MIYELVKAGKVIMSSSRKMDVTYAHQKYRRSAGVSFREVKTE